ncbi:ABC transporter B family member 11 [Rhynchospora pubera]|uniref:ABC transporter B family member 11 n=1 Tax=Rhynchospora pubera TaxID=906938 RepID=A0AAV8DE74_9POAL|nr:ABC transporter B family member 11 [Rhynchospora pubera]
MESNSASCSNSNMQEIQSEENRKKEDLRHDTVSFHKLFAFADWKDVALMVFGTVGAVASGLTWPLTTLLFGKMIDAFGGAASKHDVVHHVSKVGIFIQKATGFFGGIIVAFAKGWRLASLMMITVPQAILSATVIYSVLSKMASLDQAAYAEAATVVDQTLGSIRTVASFSGEKQAVEKYKRSLKRPYNSGVREGLIAGIGRGTITFAMFVAYSLGIWYGSKLILRRGYTGGQVINVIFALNKCSRELGQGLPCLASFASGQAAAYKMFETIRRKPQIESYSTKGKKLYGIRGDIEFSDVHFSYPTRPNEMILKGFSLSISNGTTVALVGVSGSGKSTIISLIERFYDPQEGKVLIDGVDLKEFQLIWIRGKIGLVSQEPVLFAGSIRDNIAYGCDNASQEEIRAAAELANAAGFIDKMPEGFETLIGVHGTQMSGGQKQRIAIARAILKDPKILLLDEATSALDVKSEQIVQEALDQVAAKRTTVIVAHRLSTVRNAATIAVLSHGSIIEKGPHSELIKDPNGAYSQLIHLQESSKRETYPSLNNPQASSMSYMSHENSNHRVFSTFEPPVLIDPRDSISVNQLEEAPLDISISRLATLQKPEFPFLILGSLASVVIGGVIFPVFGILISSVIGVFYKPPHELRTQSNFWSCMFLIFAVVSIIVDPVSSYSFAVAGSRLIKRVRLMTFEKIVNMEMSWFDDPENASGTIGARLSTDAAKVKGLLGDALALSLQNLATLVAGFFIAYVSNWELALIASTIMPLAWLSGFIQMKFIAGFNTDAKTKYDEASQIASEAVSNVRTVSSFSAEEKVVQLYRKKCEGPLQAGIKIAFVCGTGMGALVLLNCVNALILYAGARLVEEGKTTPSIVFRVYMTIVAIRQSQATSAAADRTKAKSAITSVFAILDRKSRIDPSDTSGLTQDTVKGNIEFQHVKFCYPCRPEVTIFHDLCLSIHAGQTVALVGESGSGKSTAIALLQRFYDPDSGQILLDGTKIQNFQISWLRKQMGLVSQEPILFNDTIRSNIAYGKEENTTESEIVAAAELANVHNFVSSLPQGYDTIVGERGVQLSGGQKQRVALARAILRDPKILLLDEATSALDVESERVVQAALDHLMSRCTALVVSHRLSTIRNADLIAVLRNGVIVEKGKHETLINMNDGAYASLLAVHSSN